MLKKIASNTLAQVFSKIITASITIVLLGLITNYLSVELFGIYNKIFNYIFIFAFLVDLGLYAITVKEISANKKNSDYIFGNILTLRLLSAILVIFLSVSIAYFIPGYNSNFLLFGIFIASIFTFFSLINSTLLALMQAYMKMEFSIISVVLNKLIVLGFTFYLIKYLDIERQAGLIYLILIVVIGMFINMILNYFYSKSLIKIKLLFDWKYIKEIFFKSLPYGIALFLGVVYTKIDIILLSFIEQGSIGDRSIALYSLPLKIMDVFMIIGGFFMNSLLPSLSENYKKKNLKKINQIISNSLKVMFSIGTIIISLGLVYKNNIIEIIANKNYLEVTELNKYTSSEAFSVILFMIMFFYLGIVFSYLLIAFDKQKKLLKISILLTISNIIGNIFLIPYLSFIGAAISTVITQVLFLILIYRESINYIKIKFPIIFFINISIFGIIIYFINTLFIKIYDLGLYFNFIYGIILFSLYSYIIWKIERKKFLFLKE